MTTLSDLNAKVQELQKALEAAKEEHRAYRCSAECNVFETVEEAQEGLEELLRDFASEDIRIHEGCCGSYIAEATVAGVIYVGVLHPEMNKDEGFHGQDLFSLCPDSPFDFAEKEAQFLEGKSLDAWLADAGDRSWYERTVLLADYAKALITSRDRVKEEVKKTRGLLGELFEYAGEYVDLSATCGCGNPGARPPCHNCESGKLGFAEVYRRVEKALEGEK